MAERPLVTVGGLIVASDGDILLVRSKKWHDLYSLPGGKVEEGEARSEAFQREVWEETRLRVKNVRFVLVQDCIFSPEFWQKRHFVMNDFIADLDPTCCKDQVTLNHEAYAYLWVKPKKALDLPLHRECRYLIEWYLSHLGTEGEKWGIIGFEHHRVSCIIGVHPAERLQEQDLYFDLKIKKNFTICAATDRVENTLDYVRLAEICKELAQNKKYHLLETLASAILDRLIQEFDIRWAWVRIKKTAAIPSAQHALVELERYL